MPVDPHISKAVVENGIGKKTAALIVLLLVLTGLKFLVFDFVVPKTAAVTLPRKWRMIPLRQTKEIVHNYLGEPIAAAPEAWADGSKGKMYFLKIYYISDTIASAYSIHYQYKNWFGSRDYLIDSFSIR